MLLLGLAEQLSVPGTCRTAQRSSPSPEAGASAQGNRRARGNTHPAKKDVGCCPQPRGKGSLNWPCPAPPQVLAPLAVALLGMGPCPSMPPPSPSWARDLHTQQHTVIPSIPAALQMGQLPCELGDTAMHSQCGNALASPGTIWTASMVKGAGAALPGWPRVHPGSGLLNVFNKDLDDGIEKVLIKFADDTKLGGTTSILEDRIRIRNDLDKLEKRTGKNRMKFNRDKCKVLR